MDPDAFRAAAHAVVDLMADYLETIESRAVFPPIEPGSLRPLFPASPPEAPEPHRGDPRRLPPRWSSRTPRTGSTRASSPTSRRPASGPGILGEMLTATLGQNAMLWRTSPIGTELEEVVVDWLRQALGLPDGFDGLLTDTASTSTLIALAAAREACGAEVAGARAGRARRSRRRAPGLRLDRGPQLGREGVHDARSRARVAGPDPGQRAVRDAAGGAGGGHRRRTARRGLRPIGVVATIGTTSSTSVDPVAAIADIAEREGLWLHVDAAYAGVVAMLPERRAPFAGWERADSIVVNPHKWLFTPLDASLLLTRRMDVLRAAFSLVPEYLRTLDRAAPVRDYNEYTPQLGRRFRALKLWIQLRWFGLDGLRRRIEAHLAMAAEPRGGGRRRSGLGAAGARPVLDGLPPLAAGRRGRAGGRARRSPSGSTRRTPRSWMPSTAAARSSCRTPGWAAGSRSGSPIGNLRTEARHVERAWELLRAAAATQTIP